MFFKNAVCTKKLNGKCFFKYLVCALDVWFYKWELTLSCWNIQDHISAAHPNAWRRTSTNLKQQDVSLNMHLQNALIYIHTHLCAERGRGAWIHVHLCMYNCVFCSPLWTDSPTAGLNSKQLLLQHRMSVQASSWKPCCSRPMGNLCPKNTHTPISTCLRIIFI